ncbi:MAG: acetate--CoA ligase family protein [Gammaproteobacteria bacterium]|nr:acetate--CoA ligase family protein [Gammaproteobacteria bacterium]
MTGANPNCAPMADSPPPADKRRPEAPQDGRAFGGGARTGRFQRLLHPASAVFIGGSGLGPAIDYCRANGFSGRMMAVNPHRAEIAGLPCAKSIFDLDWDEAPDLAFIAVPKEAVVETVAALASLGTAAAVCHSSGFSESAGGEERQAALVEAAGRMRVLGPNCPGLANFFDGAVFMMDHFGNHAPRRGVAVLSNGGAYLSDLGCADRSLPIGYLIGLGNQAMVSVADMLDTVLEDPRVTAVNIYFEGIFEVAALSRAAARAARLGKPVVAVPGGRSAAGARAAQSHTASLSGSAEVASALLRRFGWIEAHTASDAIETLKMLTLTPLPRGPKTGFVTSSGSYAVLGGDAAQRQGLALPPPSAQAAAKLRAVLPDYVGPANPLDISDAHGWPLPRLRPIYDAFLGDPYHIALQVMCYPPPGGWDSAAWDRTVEALAGAKGQRAAAFINTLPENLPRAARTRMSAAGIAPLQGLAEGMRAVARAARYGVARDTLEADAMPLPEPPGAPGRLYSVDECSAKSLLAGAGLTVPRGRLLCGENAAVSTGLTYPVALKAVVDGVTHKSEAGAVALGLADESALRAALTAMRRRLDCAGRVPRGFLVEEMVAGACGEVLVGIRRVAGVGLTLTVSVGGVAVELMDDAATLILPAPRQAFAEALGGLRLFPMIDGYRGRPAADVNAAVRAIAALADFAQARPALVELEINPLILTATGAVVADAVLVETAEE